MPAAEGNLRMKFERTLFCVSILSRFVSGNQKIPAEKDCNDWPGCCLGGLQGI